MLSKHDATSWRVASPVADGYVESHACVMKSLVVDSIWKYGSCPCDDLSKVIEDVHVEHCGHLLYSIWFTIPTAGRWYPS